MKEGVWRAFANLCRTLFSCSSLVLPKFFWLLASLVGNLLVEYPNYSRAARTFRHLKTAWTRIQITLALQQLGSRFRLGRMSKRRCTENMLAFAQKQEEPIGKKHGL